MRIINKETVKKALDSTRTRYTSSFEAEPNPLGHGPPDVKVGKHPERHRLVARHTGRGGLPVPRSRPLPR